MRSRGRLVQFWAVFPNSRRDTEPNVVCEICILQYARDKPSSLSTLKVLLNEGAEEPAVFLGDNVKLSTLTGLQ